MMQVALFITCFNDTIFPGTGKAVVSLLERLGHTVDFPMAQTCCGQMHYNTGYQRETIPLVRHFVVPVRFGLGLRWSEQAREDVGFRRRLRLGWERSRRLGRLDRRR